MITIKDTGNENAEIVVDKNTSYHVMLLGAEMLIEILVKEKGNTFEDVIHDITYIYERDLKKGFNSCKKDGPKKI